MSLSLCSRQLNHILEVQNAINAHDVINKVLPHLARRNDEIAREVLALIAILLYNANRDVQVRYQQLSCDHYILLCRLMDHLLMVSWDSLAFTLPFSWCHTSVLAYLIRYQDYWHITFIPTPYICSGISNQIRGLLIPYICSGISYQISGLLTPVIGVSYHWY